MLLKFINSKEIIEYLGFSKALSYEGWFLNVTGYRFHNILFKTPQDLVDYLIEKQIVNEVSTPKVKFKQKRYLEYNFEYYLLNTHYLNVLDSNLVVNPDININRLLSINEVCEILSVTRPTAYKLINQGKITAYIISDQRKVKYMDLLRYIEACKLRLTK